MKDLGTVPVMAYALPGLRAFYPDGAWWTPCLMEGSDGLLQQAEALGIDASFCPVRAMLAAFQNGEHFPRPDLLICSTGAVCDDFSAIAQRLEHLGHAIFWWEMPRRRAPAAGEMACALPGNLTAPKIQVDCVRAELQRSRRGARPARRERPGRRAARGRNPRGQSCAPSAGGAAADRLYRARRAAAGAGDARRRNARHAFLFRPRRNHRRARRICWPRRAPGCRQNQFVIGTEAVRIFWVNPVADLRAMNLLEDLGGRICGSDFMFTHALDLIPEDLPPLEALARTALADPMAGPATDRAARIVRECRAEQRRSGGGFAHSRREPLRAGRRNHPRNRAANPELPTIELEIPPVCDAMLPALGSRLQALMETARARRIK